MHADRISARTIRRLAAFLSISILSACSSGGRSSNPAPVAGSEAGIPVLTWHGFAEQTPARGNLTDSYARFEEMLAFLARHRFRSVFPEEVRPGEDRRRMVVLTFDDGTVEQLRAAEMMERHGFRGIFFVIPDRFRRGDARYLDSAAVARLARAGHRVAPHGYAHRSMAMDSAEAGASLRLSADTIARQAGEAPRDGDFAFPFGHYTAAVAHALHGRYRYLHTVEPGYWDGASPLLPRLLLMSDVDLKLYQDYVLGGARYRPTMRLLDESGAVADSVPFHAPGGRVPSDVHVFAVTADAEGRSYVTHPVGETLRVRGDTAWFHVAEYMRRQHPPGRAVISYALVTRDGRRVRYLTPGLLTWVRDPAIPVAPASTPTPGRSR